MQSNSGNTESNENNNEEVSSVNDTDEQQHNCVQLAINIQKELNIDDYAEQSDASTSRLVTPEPSTTPRSIQRYDSIEYLTNVLQGRLLLFVIIVDGIVNLQDIVITCS